MKTTLLNGFTDPHHTVAQDLLAQLQKRGDTVEPIALADIKIADCMGGFGWKQMAKSFGVTTQQMKAQPYAPASSR
jgi:hypothetical protein